MPLGILFWVIALICIVFGFVGYRYPQYAPFSWGPPFVLILILGWKVFGPAVH